MTNKRPNIATEEVLEYLDGLRESGETNMLGAGSYLTGRFDFTRNEAKEVIMYYMSIQ